MMLRKYLAAQNQKGKNPYKRGKQSYSALKKQGIGLSNIEITDGNIKSFERVAKEYKLDFALKKADNGKPPTYYVFFKAPDNDTMNLAFKKYVGVQMKKKGKPSIMEKLTHFKDAVAKGMNRERSREHKKVLEPGGINHSESSRNNQSELIRNSQCTCLADRLPTVIQWDR